MSAIRFAPWVGAQYATEGFRGLRVLVVSESHYGDCRYERPDVTPEIIKPLALGLRQKQTQGRFGRHPHYAKIFAATNNRSMAGALAPSATYRLLGEGCGILRKYKYPPDQQHGAAELVLQQAQALGEAWS